MSWASLTSGQIVSDTNLKDACDTGVFAARVAIPTTGRELTTTAATTDAIVSVTSGRASNQLVTKGSLSALIVGTGPYNYYVYGSDRNYCYKSSNGGFTFTQLSGLAFSGNYSCIAASYNAQYILVGDDVTSGSVKVSTNGGLNFTTISISNLTGSFTNFYPINVDMSSSGQYMAVVGKTTSTTSFGYVTVAISSNYGATFALYTAGYYSGGTGNKCSVAVSANGQYITYVGASYTGSNNSWRYYSTNYGASFTSAGLSTGQAFIDIALSSTGQYQLILDYYGNIFRSYDSGATFSALATIYTPIYCGMIDNGSIMAVCYTNGSFNLSYNYGASWTLTAGPFTSPVGMAVGVDNPIVSPYASSNYAAVFQTTYCNYEQPGPATFYSQPLGINMASLNKVYKKAINY